MSNTEDKDDVDAALEELGPLGRYTLIQYTLQSVLALCITQQMLSVMFTGQTNHFRCPITGNISTSNSSLNSSEFINISSLHKFGDSCVAKTSHNTSGSGACSALEVEYQLPKDRSFYSDFDLVCDREVLGRLSQSLLVIGNSIATFTFPYFVDHHGRKPVVLFCSVMSLLSSIGLATSVNYPMLAVFKILVGIFVQGLQASNITMNMEILVTRHRASMFACLGSVIGSLASITLSPMAYLFRSSSWKSLELGLLAFYIPILLMPFFLDESLRWLSANGRKAEVVKILKRASKQNGKSFERVIKAFTRGRYENSNMHTGIEIKPIGSFIVNPPNDESGQSVKETGSKDTKQKSTTNVVDTEQQAGTEIDKEEKLSFWQLFTDPMLRVHVIFAIVSWFFNSLTFFSLTLMASTLHGSLYLNFVINTLVEIPQAFFLYLFLDKLGRRLCFSLFSLLTGASLISMAMLRYLAPEQSIAIMVLSLIGKLSVTGSYNIIYTYTPELFPTNLRNMGFGVSYLSARVGGMLSPFSEMLMKEIVYAPGVIFGVGSLLLSFSTYFLPETTQHQLPQTLAEMKRWKENKKDEKSF
ncbi:solute carrier family 22 member 8 [Aplysia californica]|uniref:Solute carrier family 22 member 8 n=1 Tax=Aplysia californica TaxID=6500 RepID=A0ABM1A042_APLCA|nr:solute carrier family 22 member 8 [Aplysia californica]